MNWMIDKFIRLFVENSSTIHVATCNGAHCLIVMLLIIPNKLSWIQYHYSFDQFYINKFVCYTHTVRICNQVLF